MSNKTAPAKDDRIMCPNQRCRSILVSPPSARGISIKCTACRQTFKNPFTTLTPDPAMSPDEELSLDTNGRA